MPKLSEENFRVRVPEAVNEKWEKLLADHNITTQRALLSLMEWIIEEDPLTRAMIFRQVPMTERATLTKIVLERLSKGGKKRAAS